LVHKVDQIREDLGAVGELLDEATYRRSSTATTLK